ncbi:MAG TPA: heavy metal-associated domain-containing protein [Burkholderiales bacterium]|nr:heavy metal-associated domain-containing protein [Burkholderiales bacterium]
MSFSIAVENIKCGGCANSIRKAVSGLEGVTGVSVDIEQGEVRVEGDEAARPGVAKWLLGLGYPERGTASGIGSAAAKAKSFVSCAIGRMS